MCSGMAGDVAGVTEGGMTTYRCVVHHSTGTFVSYAGISFDSASAAMRQWEQAVTVVVERKGDDGWRTIMGVYRDEMPVV